jgi:hypothetical protein
VLFKGIKSHNVYCWVFGLGTREELSKFRCTIVMSGSGSGEKRKFEGPVVSIYRPMQEIVDDYLAEDDDPAMALCLFFMEDISLNNEVCCTVKIVENKQSQTNTSWWSLLFG